MLSVVTSWCPAQRMCLPPVGARRRRLPACRYRAGVVVEPPTTVAAKLVSRSLVGCDVVPAVSAMAAVMAPLGRYLRAGHPSVLEVNRRLAGRAGALLITGYQSIQHGGYFINWITEPSSDILPTSGITSTTIHRRVCRRPPTPHRSCGSWSGNGSSTGPDACRACRPVAKTGDYAVSVAGEPVAARTPSTLFSPICRHRLMLMVEPGAGRIDTLT